MDALEKRVGELPEEVYEYDCSLRVIRSTDYKLLRGSDGSCELYWITNEPDEQQDIADEQPEIIDDLEAELNNWLNSFEHADTSESVLMSQYIKD